MGPLGPVFLIVRDSSFSFFLIRSRLRYVC